MKDCCEVAEMFGQTCLDCNPVKRAKTPRVKNPCAKTVKRENVTHTPGPWRVGINHHTVYQDGGKEPCVALCPKQEAKEFAANARLIAAAPELLEALVNMVETLQWLQDSGNLKSPIEPHPYGLGVMAAKQDARATIRKATS